MGGASSGGASSALGGQGSNAGWSQASCFEALARGTTGDACRGPFMCTGSARGCCHWQASCAAPVSTLVLTEVCDDCDCTFDSSCPPAFWCTDGHCRRCTPPPPPPSPVCPPWQTAVPRNGCFWCVPQSQCAGPNGPCPSDQVCYAGRACLPNCPNDPNCCFGNICAAPGCGRTSDLDCSIVGCPDGMSCNVFDPGQVCTCQGNRWLCSTASRNKCG